MRIGAFTLCALALTMSLSACRSLDARFPKWPSNSSTTPADSEPPVQEKPKPPSPAELAGCKRTSAAPSMRFHSRVSLKTAGLEVCVFSKPDMMLAMNPPLGPSFARLMPSAGKGDAEAQFKIAAIVNQCGNIPSTQASLNSVISTALKTRRYLGGTRVQDPKAFEQQMRQEYLDCQGVDAAQRGRSREWARRAATAGLMDAQESLMFMSRPGNVFYSWNRDSRENNALDAEHYKAMMNALVAAREAGSVEALVTLGGRYAQGHRDNPPWEREYFDPVKSYAHYAAYDQIQQAIGGKRREAIKGTVVGDIYASLKPDQRASAEALAKTFLQNPLCCVVTM